MATITSQKSQSKSLDYVSTLQSSKGVPFKLKLFHIYIRTLSAVRPKKATKLLTKIFFTPQRKRTTESQLKEFTMLEKEYVTIEGREIFIMKGGNGPKVLLLHGWGSSSYTFRHLIPRILDAGLSVVAFDAPAHGLSEGKRTNIVEIARTTLEIEKIFGPFDAVVAHSLGGLVNRFANSRGMKYKRFVNLNSPFYMESVFEPFYHLLGVPKSIQDAIRREVEKVAGVSMTEIFGINENLQTELPAMLIYDKNDVVVPYKDGIAFNAELSNSNLIITEGLGHRTALSNPEILPTIVSFIKQN